MNSANLCSKPVKDIIYKEKPAYIAQSFKFIKDKLFVVYFGNVIVVSWKAFLVWIKFEQYVLSKEIDLV